MKHYTKLFFAAAVAALGLASCAKEVTPVETPKDNLVTVHFGAKAGIEGATKATLTPNEQETLFTSAWVNGDVLSVKYLSPSNEEKIIPATWNMDSFEAALPNEKGEWYYQACYPKPDEKDNHIDFGGARTQNGNKYNSTYDVMICDLFSVEGAEAGKTAVGSNVVFNMKRETAVAYFHLTDGPANEDLVSATLSVEGGFIASQHAYISDFAFAPTEDLKEITITFPEKAPKASDFQLWFNVLPTTYTKMALTVETSNHTLTISRTAEGMYEAGKLYKVSKSILAEKWAPKAAYTGGDLVFDFKTVKPEGWPTSSTTTAGTYKYAVNGVDHSFILGKGGYCAGTTPNSAYLMITKSSSLGLPAIAGYKLTKVIGTLNDAGNPSKKAEICITDGANVVSGGTAQTWDTMGKDYPYTLAETEENTVYYLSVSSTANCQMIKLVLSYEPATHKTTLETPANLQVSAERVVSWDAVSGAASYEVTIGESTFTSETTSYDAAAIADDYYDVAVVAVPSDKENYKNSAAATLTGAKFGTPTLATPTLKEGVIDGASISVSWSVDERATAGYNCELFKDGVKVGESQTVNAGAVTFTGLDAETAYVVKVNAIAVEGAKSYAASSVATLGVATKAASTTANDGSLERPYTAAEAIAAIDANIGLTGKYVKGIVKATPSFNATYSSLTYDIESGEKTLNIYSGKDLGNVGFVGAKDLKAGDEVVVCGNLQNYKGKYQVDKNNYLISINGETQIYRGLAVSGQKTAFTVGDAFEFEGKALQVWRGKADVDVTASATFSGYDMSTEGKQTVTVTVGDESVTYEITVNPAGTVPPTTVTKTISDMSGNQTDGTKVSSMAMDDVITLSASTKGNNGKVYGAEWRLYASDTGTMTVSSKAGYVIESITVTFTVKSNGTLKYGKSAVTSGKAVSVSGSSVTFTVGAGQVKVTKVSVTYKQQ